MKPDKIITLAHGGGGVRTQSLIKDIILRHLGNPLLDRLDDSACVRMPQNDIAFSTDTYVVNPIFFPGGDIGSLSVCGTINDLAMQGAEPRYLSMGLVLEEGLLLEDFKEIIKSMAAILRETGVLVVTGDTKVVERGRGNGVFINTSGIGMRLPGIDVHVSNARPGDAVIVTGSIGDHGVAVLSRREGLGFDTSLISDMAPLWGMTRSLLLEVPTVCCLRDPTRGGIAAALCDISLASGTGIRIRERDLPVKREVVSACGLLGLDVLNIANEGKAVVICPRNDAEAALRAVRAFTCGKDSRVIGEVTNEHPGTVVVETTVGGERIVDMPSGEDLPRIC